MHNILLTRNKNAKHQLFMKKIASKRFNKFVFSPPPSLWVSGGTLVGWNETTLKGEFTHASSFAIIVAFTSAHNVQTWKLIVVNGPYQGERRDLSLSTGYTTSEFRQRTDG
jgi:hypothetical protein